MQRTRPGSCADPGSAVPSLEQFTPPPAPSAPWTILTCDPRPARLEIVRRIISECGARPREIEAAATIPPSVLSCSCNLAVVALGSCSPPGNLELESIRSLQRQGLRVICYGEGAQSWPLGIRCLVLLAGSSWLLDSSKAEFAHELQRLLAQLLRAESGRRDEESRIKQVMKKLGSVGESQAIMAVFQTVLRLSRLSDVPVLITGETGTGKELLAHTIHQLDLKRCHGPFIALNCSAISPGLVESELFGHRRGAFTGADRDRKGLIRSAEGGVLFLDEIGELDDALQAKLLRVLQENRVLGVGEDREVAVSVRIIAATNRDLDAMVQLRTFRADLFHRLNVVAIRIPPLRERPADLKPLIEYFLERYQCLWPAGALAAAPEFIEALIQLQLPGNARQLENLVRWALVNKEDDTPLNLRDLPLEIWQQLSDQGSCRANQSTPVDAEQDTQKSTRESSPQAVPSSLASFLDINGWNLSRFLRYCERLLLEAALHKAHGNQSQMAHLLGITPRSVYNKVHKYQLHP
jgi:transcriptional regulator with PAS, ATPase and Fis domain